MIENNVFNSVNYVTLAVSTVCNLRCKNCITFAPYHRHPRFFPAAEMEADMERFFRVFGRPVRLDLGGGEPLLHPELTAFMEYALTHWRDEITQFRILTNGSIPIREELLRLAEGRDVFFLIDNYGPELSPAVEENAALLDARGIAYRVNTYYGDDQYFGGWIDFGTLEYQNHSPEQLEYLRLNCFDIYSESDVCRQRPCDHLHIKNGKICYCDVQQVGARHIPVNDGDYIDLRSGESDEALRERLRTFKMGLIEHCKYCSGFLQPKAERGNARVPAGIQLTDAELRQSPLDCH